MATTKTCEAQQMSLRAILVKVIDGWALLGGALLLIIVAVTAINAAGFSANVIARLWGGTVPGLPGTKTRFRCWLASQHWRCSLTRNCTARTLPLMYLCNMHPRGPAGSLPLCLILCWPQLLYGWRSCWSKVRFKCARITLKPRFWAGPCGCSCLRQLCPARFGQWRHLWQ